MKYFLLPLLVVLLGFLPEGFSDDKMTISLRWSESYPDDSWQRFRTGMIWGMSLLGADMSHGAFDLACRKEENGIYVLNLNQFGFSESAQKPIVIILDSLKKTEEYRLMCGIDAGRFLVLMLHVPHHYYAVSGAAPTLDGFKKMHGFDTIQPKMFPVVHSSIANGNRLLTYRTGKMMSDFAFIAEEGRGRVEFGNFKTTEYEVIDVMANGQLRFAIYDHLGNLEAATPIAMGEAGKPGKCMWCHESVFQPLYSSTHHVPPFASPAAFSEEIRALNIRLRSFQRSLQSDVLFDNSNDHTQHELLYITFMEPSEMRLAWEWGISVDAVRKRLSNLPIHIHHEFPWLGNLYHREDIRHFAPFQSVQMSQSVREPSTFEPNLLGKPIHN